jgi:hypothetical protein
MTFTLQGMLQSPIPESTRYWSNDLLKASIPRFYCWICISFRVLESGQTSSLQLQLATMRHLLSEDTHL